MSFEEKIKINVCDCAKQDVREFLKEEIEQGINEYKSWVIKQIKEELKEVFVDEAMKYDFIKVLKCDLNKFYFETGKRLLERLEK